MSDYPEHDKLSAVKDETQAAGAFVEWLESKGIHLMVWREDLTDTRVVDDECPVKFDADKARPCDQVRHVDGETGVAWWRRHCIHWQQETGDCHRCGRGRFREIHEVKAWTEPGKNLLALLAEWQDVDQNKLEAEKRQMLASLRAGA